LMGDAALFSSRLLSVATALWEGSWRGGWP